MMLDLSPYHWEDFPDPTINARLMERKNARLNGQIIVRAHPRKAVR